MSDIKPRTTPRNLFEGMNRTEAARATELEAMKRKGEISEWLYEAVTFKLAHDCRYTPDFMVIESDGLVRFEETKGFWRDDAKVKLRVAVKMFAFPFTALQKSKAGGWIVEEF